MQNVDTYANPCSLNKLVELLLCLFKNVLILARLKLLKFWLFSTPALADTHNQMFRNNVYQGAQKTRIMPTPEGGKV